MAEVKSYDHVLGNALQPPASPHSGGMGNSSRNAVGSPLAQDERKGAATHSFDPDASPEQKAAAAGQAKAQLAAVPGVERLKHVHDEGGRAMAIDTSVAGSVPSPTVTMEDVDRVSKGEGQQVGADSVPGSIPVNAAPPLPTWMQTGWRQVAGLDAVSAADEKTQAQSSILAEYVSDQTYGAWFHNAGIVIVAARFITSIGLGWGWMAILLAFCQSYYALSISRTRHRARDDIQRELVKTRLMTETESADWLNGFLDRFWLIYEPVLSATIVASVDAALAGGTLPGIESIRMTTFTLGTKAPRIDFVRTFPKTPEDVVIMDWALSFTPNDLQDITPRQAAKRVNPKVVLAIRVGKGALSKALPILLEDISFTGRMRIKLKLMTNFPHVQTIDLSFIEKPTFDYVLKPIGGETFGFDINNIPGLAPFIRDQVHANLGPMMYDPNVFTIDLQALLSGTPLDAAIGVLKIIISNARGLKAVKMGGGAPDPYVAVALGAKPPIAKTKHVPSTSNPTWNDTQFILITNLADVLNLSLFDFNDHRPDNLLGTVTRELGDLSEDAEQEGLVGKIISGGKDRGELRYDLSYFPVLQPSKNPDGTMEPVPDTETGVVRLTLHQAKDLDVTRLSGDLNPFAKIFLGGSKTPVHTTPVLKHANQPIWESHCEFLVPEKHDSVITIHVIDQKDYSSDPKLGQLTVRLTDLLEARERQQDWYPLNGSRAGKIRLSTDWKPVAMTGSVSGANTYVPPIGILRLWLQRAIDVKNVEATLGGKSDPYVRVMANNKVLARTEVINNNLNPEWDQIVYVPVHNLREAIFLELMDYQNIGKDRSLGHVEIKVSEFAQASGDQAYPFVSAGPQARSDNIRLGKEKYKGQLVFEADFKPAVSLRGGVSFEHQKNELEIAAEASSANSVSIISPTSSVPNGVSPISAVTNGSVNGYRPLLSPGGQSVRSVSSPISRGGGEATAAENPGVGVELTTQQLLASAAGVLVFQVISGQIAKRGSVEVLFDDGYWPSFSSAKARSNHPTWDQIGEGFVRELEFSRIWLRLNQAVDGEKEEIVAEFKCDTRDFLEQCLEKPSDFLLSQADGSNRSTVRMSARYVPVDIKLEPRESINNMGVLRVDVVGAKGLHAADRGGKSDPNITFNLNGARVFKSETKRKTLTPVWNESFEVMVPSRVGAQFEYEINDWDRVGTATHLGGGAIDLSQLEPFESATLEYPVVHEKHGEKGTLTLRMLFQPEIIARSRQKTSTFSTAGRVATTIGGVPLGVGKGVVHGGVAVVGGVGHGIGTVGHGIGSVGGFAGRRIGLMKKRDKSGKEVLVPTDEGEDGPEHEVAAGQATHTNGDHLDTGAGIIDLLDGGRRTPSEPGTLNVTVVGAKDLKSSHKEGGPRPYVQVRVGGKTHKTGHMKGQEVEWNESFAFSILPGTSSFTVTVFDHHSFGKDLELGEAEVDIWRHIQPATPNADVDVELTNGTGLIRLRLDWNAGAGTSPAPKMLAARGRVSSVSGGRTPSITSKGGPDSPGRFAMLRRRDKEKEREDVG